MKERMLVVTNIEGEARRLSSVDDIMSLGVVTLEREDKTESASLQVPCYESQEVESFGVIDIKNHVVIT
jgi:hypothetical protein